MYSYHRPGDVGYSFLLFFFPSWYVTIHTDHISMYNSSFCLIKPLIIGQISEVMHQGRSTFFFNRRKVECQLLTVTSNNYQLHTEMMYVFWKTAFVCRQFKVILVMLYVSSCVYGRKKNQNIQPINCLQSTLFLLGLSETHHLLMNC